MSNNLAILSVCRFSLAFVWIYQGIVPKWLGPHTDELAMNVAAGFSPQHAVTVSYVAGLAEVLMGLALLVFYRHRWPYLLSAVAIAGLYLFTVVFAGQFLIAAFNATTVNLAVFALSVIGLLALTRTSAER